MSNYMVQNKKCLNWCFTLLDITSICIKLAGNISTGFYFFTALDMFACVFFSISQTLVTASDMLKEVRKTLTLELPRCGFRHKVSY